MERFEAMLDRWIEHTRFHGLELPDASPRGKFTDEQRKDEAEFISEVGSLVLLGLAAVGAPALAAVLLMGRTERRR